MGGGSFTPALFQRLEARGYERGSPEWRSMDRMVRLVESYTCEYQADEQKKRSENTKKAAAPKGQRRK